MGGMTSAPLPPLPVVVVGGWLGAGKTTLVNHLLRHAGGRRVAVLVNDFGDVAIDADLIAAEADASAGVLALSGGCLCCSFGDDLVGTLNTLARRDPAPDVVLIELSGVALPAAVVRTAKLAAAVQVEGTLVLADVGSVRERAADAYVGDTVRQQLADADWVLLTQGDRAGAALSDDVERWITTQPFVRPGLRVLRGPAAALPAELVLGWRRADEPPQGDLRLLAPRALGAVPALNPAPAAALLASRSVVLPDAMDSTSLGTLGAWLAEPARGLLRAKGLARDAQGQGWLLQLAGGRVAVTPQAFDGEGRLVLIGLREAVAALGRLPLSALRR